MTSGVIMRPREGGGGYLNMPPSFSGRDVTNFDKTFDPYIKPTIVSVKLSNLGARFTLNVKIYIKL